MKGLDGVWYNAMASPFKDSLMVRVGFQTIATIEEHIRLCMITILSIPSMLYIVLLYGHLRMQQKMYLTIALPYIGIMKSHKYNGRGLN